MSFINSITVNLITKQRRISGSLMRPDTSYAIGITKPEAESSWCASSGHLAPIQRCRIRFGGKIARRYRITSTFITLMGEHKSRVTMDRRERFRGWMYGSICMCTTRMYAGIVYIHIRGYISPRSYPLTAVLLPPKPGGRTRWRSKVLSVRCNRCDWSSSKNDTLKIYLSFGRTQLEQIVSLSVNSITFMRKLQD